MEVDNLLDEARAEIDSLAESLKKTSYIEFLEELRNYITMCLEAAVDELPDYDEEDEDEE